MSPINRQPRQPIDHLTRPARQVTQQAVRKAKQALNRLPQKPTADPPTPVTNPTQPSTGSSVRTRSRSASRGIPAPTTTIPSDPPPASAPPATPNAPSLVKVSDRHSVQQTFQLQSPPTQVSAVLDDPFLNSIPQTSEHDYKDRSRQLADQKRTVQLWGQAWNVWEEIGKSQQAMVKAHTQHQVVLQESERFNQANLKLQQEQVRTQIEGVNLDIAGEDLNQAHSRWTRSQLETQIEGAKTQMKERELQAVQAETQLKAQQLDLKVNALNYDIQTTLQLIEERKQEFTHKFGIQFVDVIYSDKTGYVIPARPVSSPR